MHRNRLAPWNVSVQAVRACNLDPRVHACAVSHKTSTTSFACVKSRCAVFRKSDTISLQLDVPSAAALSILDSSEETSCSEVELVFSLIGLCCQCGEPCAPDHCPSISELALGLLQLRLQDCFAGVQQSAIVSVARVRDDPAAAHAELV